MSSINGRNPVHVDNGASYRQLTAKIKQMRQTAVNFDHVPIMRQCHDKLLARQAMLESILLSNSGNGLLPYARNLTARDYAQLAYDAGFFASCFDSLIKEV